MEIITSKQERQYIPFSECHIKEDEHGNAWIVHTLTGKAYINQSALSELAEVSRPTLISVSKQPPKGLEPFLDKGLISVSIIQNLGTGSDYVCFDSDDAWSILCYACTESPGASQRKKAFQNMRKIGRAGMQLYIMGQAGYQVALRHETDTEETISIKRTIGSWQEERSIGKASNISFADFLNKAQGSRANYGRAYEIIHTNLFGMSSDKMKELPVIEGSYRIAQNHISEPVKLAAIERVEFLVMQWYEAAEKMKILLSISVAIATASTVVRNCLGLPALPAKSKVKAFYQSMENRESAQKRLLPSTNLDLDF